MSSRGSLCNCRVAGVRGPGAPLPGVGRTTQNLLGLLRVSPPQCGELGLIPDSHLIAQPLIQGSLVRASRHRNPLPTVGTPEAQAERVSRLAGRAERQAGGGRGTRTAGASGATARVAGSQPPLQQVACHLLGLPAQATCPALLSLALAADSV